VAVSFLLGRSAASLPLLTLDGLCQMRRASSCIAIAAFHH